MELLLSSSSAALLILFLGALHLTEGGKLLVMPMDGSHWLSMKPVVERVAHNGHQVILVMPESSLVIRGSMLYTVRTYPVPYSNQEIHAILQKLGPDHFIKPSGSIALSMLNIQLRGFHMFYNMCDSLIYNKQLMQNFQEEKFDAVLTDPFSLCGVIVAEYLRVPSVNFLRGMPCALDYISSQCESPISYVPRLFTKNTDHMNFLQRLENLLMRLLVEPYYCGVAYQKWERLASEILQKEMTAVKLLSRTSVWLLRYDFVFDYPRPVMPNMVFIGGINCIMNKPISKESYEASCPAPHQLTVTWVAGSSGTQEIAVSNSENP
ncbi:UDP-glucuronosyltransferase 1-2-like [Rhinophrynus dorsalis]